VIMCVPFGVALGLVFGILAYRSKKLDDWFIRPSLDLAQTMPAFAYLVPILLLFGSGPVPGLIATAIFASPPMVRATKLALEQVPEDVQSFADMADRAADADDRRQPGDHDDPQHGHHLLDDRRRRPRL
jgi:glycine betaine/proline transport system permease protein